MDTERCRALITAIDTGSLTAAAEALKYTPSGVSRMIAALEEEMGFPLLLRGKNGVRPTQEGALLLPALRSFLRAGKNCEEEAAGIRGLTVGSLIVGTAYNAYYPRLASIISEFHDRWPGIRVELTGSYSAELFRRLRAREIDLAIASRREGADSWYPVCEDEMTAWIPAAHPLAACAAVPLSAFAEEPYIETYPEEDIDNVRILARARITPHLAFSTRDSLATYSMVEAGLGISMNNALNGRNLKGNVKILPLNPPQKVEIGIAAMNDMPRAARAFLDFLLARFKEREIGE